LWFFLLPSPVGLLPAPSLAVFFVGRVAASPVFLFVGSLSSGLAIWNTHLSQVPASLGCPNNPRCRGPRFSAGPPLGSHPLRIYLLRFFLVCAFSCWDFFSSCFFLFTLLLPLLVNGAGNFQTKAFIQGFCFFDRRLSPVMFFFLFLFLLPWYVLFTYFPLMLWPFLPEPYPWLVILFALVFSFFLCYPPIPPVLRVFLC